jgi:hypothetical protein
LSISITHGCNPLAFQLWKAFIPLLKDVPKGETWFYRLDDKMNKFSRPWKKISLKRQINEHACLMGIGVNPNCCYDFL